MGSKQIEPGTVHFFPRIQYSGNPRSMKSRLFREATEQLVASNHLYPPEDNPEHNTKTYEYRSD
jgi:hypothetical protein